MIESYLGDPGRTVRRHAGPGMSTAQVGAPTQQARAASEWGGIGSRFWASEAAYRPHPPLVRWGGPADPLVAQFQHGGGFGVGRPDCRASAPAQRGQPRRTSAGRRPHSQSPQGRALPALVRLTGAVSRRCSAKCGQSAGSREGGSLRAGSRLIVLQARETAVPVPIAGAVTIRVASSGHCPSASELDRPPRQTGHPSIRRAAVAGLESHAQRAAPERPPIDDPDAVSVPLARRTSHLVQPRTSAGRLR